MALATSIEDRIPDAAEIRRNIRDLEGVLHAPWLGLLTPDKPPAAGRVNRVVLSVEQEKVLRDLAEWGQSTIIEVADSVGEPPGTVRNHLTDMQKQGLVDRRRATETEGKLFYWWATDRGRKVTGGRVEVIRPQPKGGKYRTTTPTKTLPTENSHPCELPNMDDYLMTIQRPIHIRQELPLESSPCIVIRPGQKPIRLERGQQSIPRGDEGEHKKRKRPERPPKSPLEHPKAAEIIRLYVDERQNIRTVRSELHVCRETIKAVVEAAGHKVRDANKARWQMAGD